jgi:hypothetical protein
MPGWPDDFLACEAIGRSAGRIVQLGAIDMTVNPIGMEKADHTVAQLEPRNALSQFDDFARTV